MRYEILIDGAVVNTIEAEPEFMLSAFPDGNYREAEQVVPPAQEQRHITVGAFFDRFGAHKWPVLADTNPAVQALIKDCSVRAWIDLDDQQLDGGLAMLVDAGHAINPAAIISAPVQASEKP